MAVHATDIRLHKDCPRKFKYAKVMRLRPKEPQRALDPGRGAHEALAAFYRGDVDRNSPEALYEFFHAWCKENILSRVGDQGLDEKIAEEIENIGAVLRYYPAFAAEHDDFEVLRLNGRPLIEVEFRVPVVNPDTGEVVDYHEGRLDGIVQDEWGHLWLLEHKTLSSFPDPKLLELDEQCGFYLLAAAQLFPDLRIQGVLYNVLRKTNPAKARTAFIRRFPVVRARVELEHLRWNLYESWRAIQEDRVYLPRPGLAKCPSCAYFTLCISENQGVDLEPLIEQHYEVEQPQEVDGDESGTRVAGEATQTLL